MDKLIAFIQGTRVRFSDVWIKGVSQGKTDALVAVLLAQLSNLRYLNLESAFVERSEFIGMLLRSAIYEPADHLLPDFRHLQEVYFRPTLNRHHRNDKSVKNTEDVLPFFYLPNVEKMKVAIQTPVHFTENAARPPVPSRLKALDLTAIRESYLCKVLSITKSVTNLRWEMYYDSGIEDEVNPPIVDLDSLGAAISHVRDTLEDLTMIGSVDLGGGDQFDPAVQIKGSLHALVSMHKLSRLQIPLAFLVGFTEDITKRVQEMIPKNVEFVTLTYDMRNQNLDSISAPHLPVWDWTDHAVFGLIHSWIQDWKTCTPNLRGINLGLWELDPGEWCTDMRDQLRDLCAQAGVDLAIYEETEI
jgi:hypothetical protein